MYQTGLLLVSRFVDRDMLMRYHFGLGVGHTYATPPESTNKNGTTTIETGNYHQTEECGDGGKETPAGENREEEPGADEDDNWLDDDRDDEESGDEFSDDEEFLAREDMYGE